MMNIAIFVLMLLVLLVITILILVLKHIVLPNCPGFIKPVIVYLERKIFCNSVLRACLETYFITCIHFFVAYGRVMTYEWVGKVEMFTMLLIGIFACGFPAFITRLLLQKQGTLHQKEVR